jgi:membrane fusion protein, multidrug efflux system
VQLTPAHAPASLRIPGTALIFNAQGTQVASVTPDGRVHILKVQVGRDFGTNVEIVSGLPARARLVDNPPDTLAEGDTVKVVPSQSAPRQGAASPRAS